MFKVGDILVCKCDFDTSYGTIKGMIFLSGLMYKVLTIDSNGNCDRIGYEYEKFSFIKRNLNARVTNKIISDFFYTIKEYRKIKLERLNNL